MYSLVFHWERQVKRNRVKYGICDYKDVLGTKVVYSKFQMKKMMRGVKEASGFKIRLTHHRNGFCDWWNMDHSYPCWTVGI